ncbi:hypothetical protein Tco_1527465, partial [Tanacetum coccineum]
MTASTEALIAEFAFASTPPSPPPSPLSPWSSLLPHIPSPPLHLRAASPSTHHQLLPSEIPSPSLLLPSITHRDDIPKADMSLWKRARFTTPTSRFEVGESSVAAATRQAGHTLAHRVYYGFVNTLDASIRASESRAMTAVGEVNDRVTYLATTQRQDAYELQVRYEDAQDDRALLRAQVSLLTRKRRYFYSMASSYEREAVIARQAWSHSKDRSTALEASIRTLEARVRTLQTQHDRMEWERQQVGDMVTSAFGRIHALEARYQARPDNLEDT